jgi:ABC-type transport system involved in multi-copper enzyme maturation permease subunit
MTEPVPESIMTPGAATVEEIDAAPLHGDGFTAETGPVTAPRRPLRLRLPRLSLRATAGGIAAVGVKELRGRMRGRRAFVILTIYLLLLGGFAWMVELLMERSYSSGFGSSAAFASAAIGQGIFAALLFLETLQVVFLAPSATAGAISLEREKQTLDMLIATPITSVAIVLGKLLSALTYVFLLIVASVPLTAVVFVYGGVGPEDVLRGYAVLLATALGLGSFGLLCSSLVKRTQAATAISIFGVLAVSIGSLFVLVFWTGMASTDNGRGFGPIKGRAPEVIAYVNPFIAQADVLCGTELSFGTWCGLTQQLVPGQNGVVFTDQGKGFSGAVPLVGVANGGVVLDTGGRPVQVDQFGNPVPDVAPFGAVRDAVWPKSVATWLILSVLFLFLSIQLVSPTRRWRPHLRRRTPKGIEA